MNADGARVAWELLGAPGWPPAAGKAGPAGPCWLCGSMVAEGEGWRLKDFLTPTFTNHTLAAAPSSDTVCQPCVYLGSGESWRAYCASRPEMGLLERVWPGMFRELVGRYGARLVGGRGRAQRGREIGAGEARDRDLRMGWSWCAASIAIDAIDDDVRVRDAAQPREWA